MKHPLFRGTGLLVPVVVTLVVLASPAVAGGDHNYSVGRDTSQSNYTGLRVTRTDTAASVPNTGCTSGAAGYFQGDPIYETQWTVKASATDWLEIGTGHQCSGDKNYRFWGYGFNGGWFFLDGNGIGNGNQHTFAISRGTDSIWEFRIDGNVVESFVWDRNFGNVATGIESYAPNGHIDPHNFFGLDYQVGGNSTWTNWSGTDSRTVEDPPMCGGWNSATSFRSGQAASC